MSACSRALPQGSCELRSNRPASEAPLAVASVVWDPDGNAALLPHNDLLCALANLYGLELKTFGKPDYCSGPLAGLT